MKIQGIGTIKKETAMSILTREGREAVKSGEITTEELGMMYKHEQVKKYAKCGNLTETFVRNYARVPEGLIEKLTPEELGELVDAFHKCYEDGKKAR